jgi:hypothetical protein
VNPGDPAGDADCWYRVLTIPPQKSWLQRTCSTSRAIASSIPSTINEQFGCRTPASRFVICKLILLYKNDTNVRLYPTSALAQLSPWGSCTYINFFIIYSYTVQRCALSIGWDYRDCGILPAALLTPFGLALPLALWLAYVLAWAVTKRYPIPVAEVLGGLAWGGAIVLSVHHPLAFQCLRL